MQQKQFILQNKGMNRDLSVSKAGESSAYENHNIRITATDKDTLLSVTNERGNKLIDEFTYEGTLVGWNVLNNYLILFTVGEPDETTGKADSYIYRVECDSFSSVEIFKGDLGFDAEHPIESIVDYETETIQKIYWVDGIHVLRFLNFSDEYLEDHLKSGTLYDDPVFTFSDDPTWFDSTRSSLSMPTVVITKDNSGNNRPNGVTQYFLTYYNKNGQQTGIIYSSPLVYLSPEGRGGAADETNSNKVTLSISNLDTTFEYVRLYQIMRTSLDGQVVAYMVADAKIVDGKAVFVDDWAHQTVIDATSFLYLGSQEVKAGTMTHKDETLFLGNLASTGYEGIDEIEQAIKETAFNLSSTVFRSGVDWESAIVSFVQSTTKDLDSEMNHIPYVYANGYYPYENQLQYTNAQISTFKGGEKYRFALRFIRSNGTTSQAFWIGDKVNPYYPKMQSDATVIRALAVCDIPDEIIQAAENAGFTGVQLMVAQATYSDRSVQAQGIVNPTVFNLYNRYLGTTFAQSSWINRPKGGNYPFMHFSSLVSSDRKYSEMQTSWWGGNDSDTGEPIPFYYTDSAGKLVGTPYGYREYNYLSVTVEVYAQGGFTKYWGVMHVNYYENSSDTEPGLSYEYNIGAQRGDHIVYNDNLLRMIKDWQDAYVAADVPEGNRAPESTMRIHCAEALSRWDAARLKPGESDYYLGGASGTKVAIDFATSDPAHAFSRYNRQNYFIDENIVTLNSPEIDYGAVSLDHNSGLKFRIVGAARLTSNITDYTIETENAKYPGEHVLRFDFSHQNLTDNVEGLSSWPIYSEYGYQENPDHTEGAPEYITSDSAFGYMTYLWHKNGSIPVFGDEDSLWSMLLHKRIANLHYAYYSVYNNYMVNTWSVTPEDIRQLNAQGAKMYELQNGSNVRMYSGTIDDLVIMPGLAEYPILFSRTPISPDEMLSVESIKTSAEPVHVTYDSNPHAVIALPSRQGGVILPYMFPSEQFDASGLAPTVSGQSGPFMPWETGTTGGSYRLLYRIIDINDPQEVSDLDCGSYGPFSVLYRDETNYYVSLRMFFTDDSAGELLREKMLSLKSFVDRNYPDKQVFIFAGLTDHDTNIVDISKMRIEDFSATATRFGENTVTFHYTSSFPLESITLVIYDRSDGEEELIRRQFVGNALTSNEVSITSSMALSDHNDVEVEAYIEYKSDSIDGSVIIPDLNITGANAIPLTEAAPTGSVSYCRYAVVSNAKYSPAGSDGFVYIDVALTPNWLIEYDLEDEMYVAAGKYKASGETFIEPEQKQYVIEGDKFITPGNKYLFIGELYKDYDALALQDISLDTRYGGITHSAVENNTFIPAGKRALLSEKTMQDNYAKAVIDCSDLYAYLSGRSSSDESIIYSQVDFGSSVFETIALYNISALSAKDFLPTNANKAKTLHVEYDETNNEWVSVIGELTDEQTSIVANSADYKICVLRYGYTRRGKWRKYRDKKGNIQTSHTDRYDYREYRVGYSNGLPPKRMRIIGNDLLISNKPMDQQTESSTWKTGPNRDGHARKAVYHNATLVSPLGTALVLPPVRSDAVTINGRYSNKSNNGITDLYLGLYHREGKEWKLASNIVQVRGRNNTKTQVWQFRTENVIARTE